MKAKIKYIYNTATVIELGILWLTVDVKLLRNLEVQGCKFRVCQKISVDRGCARRPLIVRASHSELILEAFS